MSRTKRSAQQPEQEGRSASAYRREQRRKLLRDFEREYVGRNKSPVIEL